MSGAEHLYLHEVIDIVGLGAWPYMEHTARAVGDEKVNFVLQGTYYTMGITGRWSQVINIWDIPGGWDGWRTAVDSLNLKRTTNTDLEDWWKEAFKHRTGGFDRLLIGAAGCPRTEELVERGVVGSLFVHELTTVRPGARRMPSVANAILGSAAVRIVNERVLGIHRERALPRWAARTLRAQWTDPGTPPDVLLFNDTFTNYFHPEIGLAAREVLESWCPASAGPLAGGISVGLARNVCCGRPLISQGLLARARDLARENTRRLLPLAAAGHPLLFLEPSCLSALREDAPALLRGAEQRDAQQVADACLLFEEFLDRETAAGRLQPRWRHRPAPPEHQGHSL